MDANFFKGNWKQIKGEFQRAWGALTDDELEQTKGDANVLAGLLQKKYGIAKDEALTQVNGIIERHKNENREEEEPRRIH